MNLIDSEAELGLNRNHDTTDGEHLNYFGATKVTEFVGNYLVENYDLHDHRNENTYAFMNDKYKEYLYYRNKMMLNATSRTDDYTDVLTDSINQENTIVVMAYGGEATKYDEDKYEFGLNKINEDMSESVNEKFEQFGIKDFNAKIHSGQIFILHNGQLIYETSRSDEEHFDIYEDKIDGVNVFVKSSAHDYPEASIGKGVDIIIDGKISELYDVGWNVVVYNTERKEIIDQGVLCNKGNIYHYDPIYSDIN